MSDLSATIAEALATLQAETGLEPEALFGARLLEPEQMTPKGAHAAGVIEGAAIALGLTALELLDEILARAYPDRG